MAEYNRNSVTLIQRSMRAFGVYNGWQTVLLGILHLLSSQARIEVFEDCIYSESCSKVDMFWRGISHDINGPDSMEEISDQIAVDTASLVISALVEGGVIPPGNVTGGPFVRQYDMRPWRSVFSLSPEKIRDLWTPLVMGWISVQIHKPSRDSIVRWLKKYTCMQYLTYGLYQAFIAVYCQMGYLGVLGVVMSAMSWLLVFMSVILCILGAISHRDWRYFKPYEAVLDSKPDEEFDQYVVNNAAGWEVMSD